MSATDPAAARWAAIQMVRAIGVASALVGVLIVAQRIPALDFLPEWFGYVLILNGMFDLFALPLVLARRWRSPPR